MAQHWLRAVWELHGDEWYDGYESLNTYSSGLVSAGIIKQQEVTALENYWNSQSGADFTQQVEQWRKDFAIVNNISADELIQKTAEIINNIHYTQIGYDKKNHKNLYEAPSEQQISDYIKNLKQGLANFNQMIAGAGGSTNNADQSGLFKVGEGLSQTEIKKWIDILKKDLQKTSGPGSFNRDKGAFFEFLAQAILTTMNFGDNYDDYVIGAVSDELGQQLITDIAKLSDESLKALASQPGFYIKMGLSKMTSRRNNASNKNDNITKDKRAIGRRFGAGFDYTYTGKSTNTRGWYTITGEPDNMYALIKYALKNGKIRGKPVTLQINEDFAKTIKDGLTVQSKIGNHQNWLNNSLRDKFKTEQSFDYPQEILTLQNFYQKEWIKSPNVKSDEMAPIKLMNDMNNAMSQNIGNTSLGENKYFFTAKGFMSLLDFFKQSDSYIYLKPLTNASLLGVKSHAKKGKDTSKGFDYRDLDLQIGPAKDNF